MCERQRESEVQKTAGAGSADQNAGAPSKKSPAGGGVKNRQTDPENQMRCAESPQQTYFPPPIERCSEGLDAFRFFFKKEEIKISVVVERFGIRPRTVRESWYTSSPDASSQLNQAFGKANPNNTGNPVQYSCLADLINANDRLSVRFKNGAGSECEALRSTIANVP